MTVLKDSFNTYAFHIPPSPVRFTVNYLFFCSVGQVTLLFVGDVAFSGPVKYYVEHGYHIYNDSFNDVAPYIREADISVANLESPFVSKGVYRYKYKGRKEVILDASANAATALRLARDYMEIF